MKCPLCHSDTTKVIYLGLPMKICENELCAYLWGFWSYLIAWGVLPFNGMFMAYEGNYFKALWHWMDMK